MNLYEVLGLDKTATQEDIKKAYRKMTAAHHPDRAGGDHDKFVEVQLAYDLLSDPEKKHRYDTTGSTKPEVTAKAKAATELMTMFNSILGNPNFVEQNLKDLMLDDIRNRKVHLHKIQRDCQKARKQANKTRHRLTCKSTTDLLSGVLRSRRLDVVGQYWQVKQQLEVADEMYNLLDDYEYEVVQTRPAYNWHEPASIHGWL